MTESKTFLSVSDDDIRFMWTDFRLPFAWENNDNDSVLNKTKNKGHISAIIETTCLKWNEN